MATDGTPTEMAPDAGAAAGDAVDQNPSLRPLLVVAVALLLSLWLVGEAWAHTIGSVGGCGGG